MHHASFYLGCAIILATKLAAGQNLIPNGDFSDSLAHWQAPREGVAVVEQDGRPALRIEAPLDAWRNVISEPVPVAPHTRYRFSAETQRIEGGRGFNLHLEWFDAAGERLGYEYTMMPALVGDKWEVYGFEAIVPPNAAHAKIVAGMPPGWAMRLRDVSLTPIAPVGPKLAIDLLPPLLAPAQEAWVLEIQMENRGTAPLSGLTLTLDLPEGVQAKDLLRAPLPDLGYSERCSLSIPVQGRPRNPGAPIRCRVTGQAEGEQVAFEAATPAFISAAQERVMPTAELTAPEKAETKVKLGAYYFPVMLDWDRSGWGVRDVDYLEPRLGYYDEALPEVADWHIYWAVEHGMSFFVFDWYFNRGMDYLNDALEQGFLKSRFRDKMEFCIDWCNEGHAAQFQPVTYDDAALRQFITTLCERYFVYDNYLRVDDKPVVFIHVPVDFANGRGGWEGCAEGLDFMRGIAREYGHPGVHFVAVHNNTPYLLPFKRGGFDAVTAYAYGFRDLPKDPVTNSLSYPALVPRHIEAFAKARQEAHAQGLQYIPPAWVGWDDYARNREHVVRTRGASPQAFRRMLEALPDYVEDEAPLALFESWNEWGEGGQAEPGEPFGYARLSAIRDVLSGARGPYTIAAPPDGEVAAFGTKAPWNDVHGDYLCRHARKLKLEQGLDMSFGPDSLSFQSGGQVARLEMQEGALHLTSLGQDPSLIGPPCMALPAESVAAVAIELKATAGDQGELYWRPMLPEGTPVDGGWSAERSVAFPITPGERQTVTIPLAEHPAWRGRIYQFRLDPANATGEITLYSFRTIPAEEGIEE